MDQPLNNAHTNAHTDVTHTHTHAHTIDYVLVYRTITTTATTTTTATIEELEEEKRNDGWRKNFEEELCREGLVLQRDGLDQHQHHAQNFSMRFVKIHAPFEVCTRYAEILKLRMPMKEFPGLPPLEFSPPAMLQDMTDCVSRVFNFVRLSPSIFPPKNRHFTAVYTRDKDYL
ncbi:Anoctamin-5 [Chionoecetes opilio]|uniref:Anoctamin-5 n=1 Tax=Chionoecetes opilio TaxID=41210 RepID=A0A8J4XZP5_CHIOP|nr:Anoctamin-5 [Chionoecetes opilio]